MELTPIAKSIWSGSFARGIKGEYETTEDYFAGQVARAIPIIGDFIKAYDSVNYYSDYNKNKGLKWTDYKYGRGVNTSGVVSSTQYVSSNILSLYK